MNTLEAFTWNGKTDHFKQPLIIFIINKTLIGKKLYKKKKRTKTKIDESKITFKKINNKKQWN